MSANARLISAIPEVFQVVMLFRKTVTSKMLARMPTEQRLK